MSSVPKPDSPETPFVVGRRSARLSMIIPITIHGMDSGGQLFRENTWTIGVNKQGAKIATFRPLPLGGNISVTNPVLGRTAKARIIWVGEKRFPEDPYEVGVELVEAQNVWGIKFPPEDWQKPASAGPAKGARGPEAESRAVQPAAKPSAPEAVKSPESSKPAEATAAAPTEKDSGAPPEKLNQFNLALAGLSHFTQEAGEKVEARPETPAPSGVPAPPDLPGVVELMEKLQEREKNLRSLEAELKYQAEQMQSSRQRVEALLADAEEAGRRSPAEAQINSDSAQQATTKALESALAELDAKVREEIESASSRLAGETRKQLQNEASITLEAFSHEASARLNRLSEECVARATPELQAREAQATERARAEINQAVEAAAAEFRGQLSKLAGEREQALRPEIEKVFEGSAQQLLERLTRSFEERAQSVSANTAQELEEKLAKLRAQALEQGLAVRQKGEQDAEEFKRNLSDRVNWALESLNVATGAAASKLYDAYQKTEADFKSLNDYSARKMAELSSSGIEAYRQKTQGLLADFQASLQKTWTEYQEKGIRDAAERVQKNSEELVESWARQLQKQAEDVLELMAEQLKENGKRAVDDTRQQLDGAARSTRESLDAEAQSAAQAIETLGEKLAASGQTLLEETAKQLSGMTHVVLESLTQEARTVSEQCRSEMRKTLVESYEKGPRELQAQLARTVERLRETIQTELEKQARNSTDKALAEIHSRSEQVAKQASDSVYKQVGVGAVVLKDWADQARAQLERFFESSAEGFEKRIAGLSEASLEKHRQGSETLADDLRARLQMAARIFHEEGAEPEKAQPGSNLPPAPPVPPAPLAYHSAPTPASIQDGANARQEPDALIERLKRKQELAVSEAAEAFRKKLAEMLSPFGQKPGEPEKKG